MVPVRSSIARNIIFVARLLSAMTLTGAPNELDQPKEVWGFLKSSKCPTEYYVGIGETHGAKLPANAGDEIVLECSDFTSFVYPTTNRICKSNGAWSGAPPLCVRSNSADFSKATIQNIRPCTATDCAENGDDWRTVGRPEKDCSFEKNDNTINGSQRQVLITFPHPVHLSFVTIALPKGAQPTRKIFNVEVKARRRDIINHLSAESHDFLEKHYKIHSRNQMPAKNACTVTRIGVFASQILVEFSLELNSLLPEFSVILVGDRRNSADCSRPPTIPGQEKVFYEDDGRIVTIFCHEGYEPVNPINQADLIGTLVCSPEYGWHPYPFPVCRRLVQISDSSKDDVHHPATRAPVTTSTKIAKGAIGPTQSRMASTASGMSSFAGREKLFLTWIIPISNFQFPISINILQFPQF